MLTLSDPTPSRRAGASAGPLGAYNRKLACLPAPGSGACHAALLGCATLGVAAGLSDGALLDDLRAALPHGTRAVGTRELQDAVTRARQDTVPAIAGREWQPAHCRPRWRPAAPPRVTDWGVVLNAIVQAGGGDVDPCGPDFWESSRTRIDWLPEDDAAEFISYLFAPDEHLFIGHREAVGKLYCRTAAAWCAEFRERTPTEQFGLICPNPVTGDVGMTRAGGPSYRALGCLAAWRYGVAEFDRADMTKPRQLAFWRGLGLPNVAAIVDSGNRSLHVWLRFDATDAEHWSRSVKPIFQRLAALGADAAGQTGGQLCRLPGVPRPEKAAIQRLLWLCPEGGRLP